MNALRLACLAGLFAFAAHAGAESVAGAGTQVDAARVADAVIGSATDTRPAEPTPLQTVQTRWAEIKYQMPEDKRADAFEQLVQFVRAARQQDDSVELQIWEGIVLASQAGAQGGLGALSLVKAARVEFEQAIQRDPQALAGSAYVSLGSLYYQVPGWPIGFGDDDKAEKLLKQGLAIDPDGIDANFFYGDFLLDQKRWQDAETALKHALDAAPRPGRALADSGRRQEVQTALQSVRQHLAAR